MDQFCCQNIKVVTNKIFGKSHFHLTFSYKWSENIKCVQMRSPSTHLSVDILEARI